MKKSLAVAALSLATCAASAQQTPFAPGEYLDNLGGWLIIKPGSDGTAAFTLHTVGRNFHICDASGVIQKNRQAVLKADAGMKACRLYFEQTKDGIQVDIKDQCTQPCGAGATLDGIYRKPAAGCERAAVRKSRDEFKRFYDKKAYAEARGALEPLLKSCTPTLDNNTTDWIRNDLALTYHRLGDNAACRKTLEPLAEDAKKTDAQIEQDYPAPSEREAALRLVRAARTNLKLCAK